MSVATRRRGNRFAAYWTEERTLEAVRLWAQSYGEPPRQSDWNPTRCAYLAAAGEVRVRDWQARISRFHAGDWPTDWTIRRLFGNWNSAIEQAGFTPRLVGQRTRRGETPSYFLAPLSHSVKLAFEAEDNGDDDTLRAALRGVIAVSEQLLAELGER